MTTDKKNRTCRDGRSRAVLPKLALRALLNLELKLEYRIGEESVVQCTVVFLQRTHPHK